MKKKFIFLLFFLFVHLEFVLQANEFQQKLLSDLYHGYNSNETGPFYTAIRCEDWKAEWIGRPEEHGYEKPFVYTRKSFSLDSPTASAVIHITANRSYKLYVNGSFVGDGPPRNSIPRFFYVSYEVISLLKPGVNAIAIEYAGAGPFEGVIAQFELRNGEGKLIQIVSTDKSWKLTDGPWANSGALTAGHNPTEVFDANLESPDWKKADFNDKDWPYASVMGAAFLGPVPGNYKNVILEPSILPHFQREIIKPAKIEFKGEVVQFMGDTKFSAALQLLTEIPRPSKHTCVENAEELTRNSNQPAIVHTRFAHNDIEAFNTYWDTYDDIPEVYDATLILDYGSLHNAFFELDIEGNEGAIIDISWGQMLVDGRVPAILYARFGPDAEGKPNQFNAHRYILREGRQIWESFNWQNFRYVQLTFRKLNGPLKIHSVNAVASGLPWDQRGKFSCSDTLLMKFYEMTGNTLRAASYDAFMDNTIREKTIWGGDICDGSMSSCLPLYGDVPILQNYMDLWVDAQGSEGWLPQQVLGKNPAKFSSHGYKTGFWLAEYAYWCEDQEHYRETVWPAVVRLLNHYKTKQNQDGLIEQKSEMELWVDWCSGLMTEGNTIPYNAEMLSVPVNLLYVSLLNKAASVAEGFGEMDRAREWFTAADRIDKVIYNNFWDEKTGLYLDGVVSGYKCSSYSEHANYLAILNGLGRNGRSERILAALLDPGRSASIVQSGPPFMLWPLKGLYAAGEDHSALEMVRNRYSRYLRMGLETFCETWTWSSANGDWNTRYRSLAQNGAGSPAWFMATEVLGVKPVKPGFTEFEISPKPGGLDWAEGVVPSPKGDIPVRWEKKNGKYHLEVTIPEGTKAIVRLPGMKKAVILRPGFHKIDR